MRRLAAIAVTAAALLLSAAPVGADAETTGRIAIPRDGFPERDWRDITIRAAWGPAARAAPGWGFVRVELENKDVAAHNVRLDATDWNEHVVATKRTRLEPGARATVWVPRLPTDNEQLRVTADVGEREQMQPPNQQAPLSVLVVRDGRPSASRGSLAESVEEGADAHFSGSGSGATYCAFSELPAADLPPTWTYLSAASLVLVEASAKGLDDVERQRTLLQYVRAGGTLAVVGATALPKGPLADEVRGAGAEFPATRHGTLGFGRWFATDKEDLADGRDRGLAAFWLGGTTGSKGAAIDLRRIPTVLATDLAEAESIPGLGRVDVRLYFLILVLFAVLVGPVAYVVLKRRRRLVAMLFVVPAAGLLFAGAILAYGLLSEGLGTRGVVTSVTFLDQRDHEAVCTAGRTLYAGFSPSRLRVSPDSVVYAPGTMGLQNYGGFGSSGIRYSYRVGMHGFDDSRRQSERFVLDADAGSVEGDALPSRTVTSFATATRARARERIRFRGRTDGGYDVLTAEGFAPLAVPDSIVLCDSHGDLYLGDGPSGPLRRVASSAAQATLDRFRTSAGALSSNSDDADPTVSRFEVIWSSYDSSNSHAADRQAWALRALPWSSASLPKSSYVAQTTRAPGFDDFGLSVDWKSATHFVFALLAPDDVE